MLLAACLLGGANQASGQDASISPGGPEIPENLLRIELHFTRPLAAPLEPSEVHLYDAAGHEIAAPFLDQMPASVDGRDVTILMHPGP